MDGFSNLIIAITVCGILRSVASLISPDSKMKKVSDTTINIIMFSVIFTSVLDIIKNIFT